MFMIVPLISPRPTAYAKQLSVNKRAKHHGTGLIVPLAEERDGLEKVNFLGNTALKARNKGVNIEE